MFKQSNNNSLFDNYLYERVIPKDNFLKQLSEAIGFLLVNDICLDKYENYGKPEILFKILFLSFLHDVSLREME